MAMDSTMTERAITPAELHLIYAAVLANPTKSILIIGDKSDKIDFEGFLSCLIRIAEKCYPSCKSKEEAMQQLLMDNVLPLAPRRKPISVQYLLKQPPIEALFKYYEDALMELYKFYTMSSDKSRKGKHMLRSTTHMGSTFDDQRELIEEAKQRLRKESPSSHKMGYEDFIRFATDFGIVTSTNASPALRRISFAEFWEDKRSLTSETKVKGLFLSIWRHVQSCTADNMSGYGTLHGGGFNTYKGALLRGTQLLNDRFVAAWTKDEYRDYLAPLIAPGTGSPVPPSSKGGAKAATPLQSGAKKSGGSHGKKDAPSHSSSTNLQSTGSPSPLSKGSTLTRLLTEARTPGSATTAGSGQPDPDMMATSSASDVQNRKSRDDAFSQHRLHNLNHDSVRQSADFLVKGGDGRYVRVLLGEYEEFDDSRLTVGDLRELFHRKPDLARLMADILYEEGLEEVQEDLPTELLEDDQDEDDQGHDIEAEEGEDEDNAGQALTRTPFASARPASRSNNNPSFSDGIFRRVHSDGSFDDDLDESVQPYQDEDLLLESMDS
eukprot:scaffold11522_cov239-Ochromonas_danica.AAC.4